jgi:hypothetical protein
VAAAKTPDSCGHSDRLPEVTMIAIAPTSTATPQLTRASDRFAEFARHLVKEERASVQTLLDLIEKPERHQDEFIAYLCDINTSDFRPLDTWEDFLARNLKWREFREGGMTIDTPQLVVDLTKVPEDERPEHGEPVSFSVKARNKQLCPDAFSTWTLVATAYREDRYGRPCVIWEVEQTI